jgi:hypothetical protein
MMSATRCFVLREAEWVTMSKRCPLPGQSPPLCLDFVPAVKMSSVGTDDSLLCMPCLFHCKLFLPAWHSITVPARGAGTMSVLTCSTP